MVLRIFRFVFGLLGTIAVIAQFQHGLQREDFIVANFFSFFTIQSNIMIAAVLLAGAFLPSSTFQSVRFQLIRGAVTAYIMTTGIVYFLLLRGLEESLQTPIPWVNSTLHYVLPIVALIDWAATRSTVEVKIKHLLLWLLYPLAYLVYSLIRGPFVDWYPYPFIDPRPEGYGTVVIGALSVTVLIFIVSLIVFFVRKLQRRSSAPAERSGVA